jgi:hypothetical protein
MPKLFIVRLVRIVNVNVLIYLQILRDPILLPPEPPFFEGKIPANVSQSTKNPAGIHSSMNYLVGKVLFFAVISGPKV